MYLLVMVALKLTGFTGRAPFKIRPQKINPGCTVGWDCCTVRDSSQKGTHVLLYIFGIAGVQLPMVVVFRKV